MLQKWSRRHCWTFSFIRGISLKALVTLVTRCGLKLSSNSLEESVSGEISKTKSPYIIETAGSVTHSIQPSTSVSAAG